VTELEQLKSERNVSLCMLIGLTNAPRTKRALKRHIELLEKQIDFLEGGSKDISPLVQFARKTPLFKLEIALPEYGDNN
jgi:hypothetical protein